MREVQTELLPLSYINQYLYCPRRFWYIYVQGEMKENVHVLRGVINHTRAHTPGYENTPVGITIHRRVYVYSHRLGISGYCDLLEEHTDGRLVPVEYKQGQQGKWHNDEAQLCAQALCLEEMPVTKGIPPIEQGAIFYFGSRRRVAVTFTPALRAQTESCIQAMQRTLAQGIIPPHTDQRQRCSGCSLLEVCLPQETEAMQQSMKDE